MTRFALRSCCAFFAVVVLSACQQTGNRAPVSYGSYSYEQNDSDSKESVLYPVVEESAPDLTDPLTAHMMARKEVDPVHVSKRNAYVHYENEYPQLKGAKAFTNTYQPVIPPIKPRKGLIAQPMEYSGGGATIPRPEAKPNVANKIAYHTPVLETQPGVITVQPMAVRHVNTAIQGVRIGDHPGKTRIVVDVSDTVDFDAWLQDDNHVLVLRVPDSRVEAGLGKVLSDHPLVKAYGFQRKGDEQHFIMTFKRSTSLTYKAMLGPNANSHNYRIVIDVKS